MNSSEIKMIHKCCGKELQPFYYFKDRYAFFLLEQHIESKTTINQLKKSRYAKLLQKPLVTDFLANLGSGELTKQELQTFWPSQTKAFRLSLGEWGEEIKHRKDTWLQTTRPGKSLVLQLNFAHDHDIVYDKYVTVDGFGRHFFDWDCHPTSRKFQTLAWARLDVDFSTGEVLIEEIQTDWLRALRNTLKMLDRYEEKEKLDQYWVVRRGGKPNAIREYGRWVQNRVKNWEEIMLTATLQFCTAELGLRKIWYHSFQSGNFFKGLERGSQPPKSLYTKVPKQFCFEQTTETPQLLADCHYLKRYFRRGKNYDWFRLEL